MNLAAILILAWLALFAVASFIVKHCLKPL